MEIDRNGWTLDAFRVYVEMRFNELEKRIEQRFTSEERARTTALDAADKRLNGMNEFRETLSDQNKTFMPRTEAEKELEALGKRLTNLETSETTTLGRKAGSTQIIAILMAVGAIAVSVISTVINFLT